MSRSIQAEEESQRLEDPPQLALKGFSRLDIWLLEGESDPQQTASSEVGTSFLQLCGMNRTSQAILWDLGPYQSIR